MKILVVGSGGREHAIIRKLKQSPRVSALCCAPGNGGIAADAQCFPVKATDVDGMVALAKAERVDFVVVTPDDPLVLGMVDALAVAGIPAFGPDRAAARIEGSKVFAKDLMKRYGIPTAAYETFDSAQDAIGYIAAQGSFPTVIKADGLALGKGVVIAQSLDEAKEAVTSIMEDKIFGASGSHIVIEEFLTGPEVSVLAFCDGDTVVPMVSAMDHKRALDGDRGPNTGGMGTVAPNAHYTPEIANICMDTIYAPTLAAMRAEGCPFSGCLFFGLMLTPNGPKVIEYNCRFGDPETQVVLPLLESDLLEIMLAIGEKRLGEIPVRFSDKHAACVVLASGGYPGTYDTGLPIAGLDAQGQHPNVTICHAGTRLSDSAYLTAGGRVLGVCNTAESPDAAIAGAYAAAKEIDFTGVQYRRDIGARNRKS